MSRSTHITLKSNIPAGIHLSVIVDVKNLDGNGVLLTLSDTKGQRMDVVVGVKSKRFKRLLIDFGIKGIMLQRKDILHKKGWILVKAIITMDDLGNKKEERVLFDTSATQPVHKDDPSLFNGELMGDFVEYKMINTIPQL